ncbi:MAG: hypothetical protein BAJALOKI2v1_30028 [Promethearchaeota archaeon]|nr:MAG: hypothetical protein BAJALOKI2v1_30028 [Candidatus Lokiarchaeota archaeon]
MFLFISNYRFLNILKILKILIAISIIDFFYDFIQIHKNFNENE